MHSTVRLLDRASLLLAALLVLGFWQYSQNNIVGDSDVRKRRATTMDATKPEKSTQEVEATTVEGEIRDLVRTEASAPSGTPSETIADLGSVNIAPLIQKVVDPSIAEFAKLIGELQEARTYLQSEGERIGRETDRYIQLAQTASASVKLISGAIGEWRKAG